MRRGLAALLLGACATRSPVSTATSPTMPTPTMPASTPTPRPQGPVITLAPDQRLALGGGLTVHFTGVVVEVDGWELMTHYAALGLGLTVVNAYIPAPPGTVAVPIVDLPPLRVHLVKRRGAPVLPEVTALEQHLARHLGGRAAPTTP